MGSNPTGASKIRTIMNNVLKKIQKDTRLKMGKYDNEKNRLYNMCQMSILTLEALWEDIVKNNLQHEQFTLDWLDKINEISIR